MTKRKKIIVICAFLLISFIIPNKVNAKESAIVIEEIYDVMKENQPYDEKRYTQALRNMVQQCIDYEDTYEILTEWDEWGFSSRL